ncbi:hypothetical protein PTKIN_Ptkin06aG0086400 [Pterospermum kingtungense]
MGFSVWASGNEVEMGLEFSLDMGLKEIDLVFGGILLDTIYTYNKNKAFKEFKVAIPEVLQEDEIPPLLLKEQPKSKKDDEDVDDNYIKESWEDEDEPPQV